MKELLKNNKFRWLAATLLVVAPFEVLSLFSIHLPLGVELPLFFVILAVFGRKVLLSGVRGLLKLDFSNINLLMTIAIFGAIYLGEFEEAVIIVVLFALGDTLEEFGVKRSQAALQRLVEKIPKSAQIKGKEGKVPVESVEVGEVFVVKPGDEIPLDGEVIEGSSLVDEAAITGEPLPGNKFPGDMVYAGTVNGGGYLEVRVTKKAKDTTLSKIIDLTYKSAEKKASAQRFVEKFARFYTPFVVAASVLLVIVPVVVLGKPFDRWLTQALTLLIISCPCALVLSTPVAVFSAIGNASQKGAIVKGGKFIEEMGRIKAVAFDKTRTLTRGEPVVSDVVPFDGSYEGEVIACAAGLETFSEHPIAKSVLSKARELGVEIHPFEVFEAVPGKGIKGECTVCFDRHHCLGTIRFVTEEHVIADAVLEKVGEFEKQGKTAVVISDDKKVKGIIGVTDEIRKEARPMVEMLVRLGIVPVMLTGDNRSSAEFVASQLGIETVKAELLPDQKVEELSKLLQQFGPVAMVGDGVNDAPVLVASSVGIALGTIGSDVAIENADIALMNDDLRMIPYLVGLGRKCVQKLRFNILSAVAVKFLFLILAVGGMSNLALAIFADVGVTVLVILNGLRLYGYKGI